MKRSQVPSLVLLSKLGSIAVHAEEYLEANARNDYTAAIFDRTALMTLLDDEEVKQWIEVMGPLLPLKRNAKVI